MKPEEYKIISRADAKAQGLKYYFTGTPCSRGSISHRLVSNKHCRCDKCSKHSAETSRKAYEKNRESRLEYAEQYRKENKDAVRELNARYHQNNRGLILDRKRQSYRDKPEVDAERGRRWRKENPEKMLARNSRRRAAKRRSIPAWFSEWDEFVIQEAYALKYQRQEDTGIEWHVDHMIPLRARNACGLHCAANIQVIPAVMNLNKNNKMLLTEPLEWLGGK